MTNAAPAPGTTAAAPVKTLAILSLVFGIVSIVLALFFPIGGVALGVAAIVLGFMSRKREAARSMALTGIILGFVGVAGSIVSWIVAAAMISQMMN